MWPQVSLIINNDQVCNYEIFQMKLKTEIYTN